MGHYDAMGNWRPGRRNSFGAKCLVCKRVFEAGRVPVDHICADCRPVSRPQPSLIDELIPD